jgi:uncharacterized protein YlxW (UPF0749 family)
MQDNMTYLIIIGAAVVALAALAALVNYIMSIVRGFQEMRHAENPPRNPPLPEEVAKAYATKRELAEEIAELKQELKDERRRVDAILKQQFDLIRKLSEDTFEKFSVLMASLKDWQLGIERMLGRIEGKVDDK